MAKAKVPLDFDGNWFASGVHRDFADGKYTLLEVERTDPVTKKAAALRDNPPKGDWWEHVGVIPRHVFNRACREGWVNDQEAWKKWLNDPENRAFRTSQKKI